MGKHDEDKWDYFGWAIVAWMVVFFGVIIPSVRWLVFHHLQEKIRPPANAVSCSSDSTFG
jgi:hypothetical protein